MRAALGGGQPRWTGLGHRSWLAWGLRPCPGCRLPLPQQGSLRLPAPPPPPLPLPRAPALASTSPLPFPGPRTCKELLTRGHFLSGWHTIYLPDCQPLTVLCDMDTDGGGWTVSAGSPRRPRGLGQRWAVCSWESQRPGPAGGRARVAEVPVLGTAPGPRLPPSPTRTGFPAQERRVGGLLPGLGRVQAGLRQSAGRVLAGERPHPRPDGPG